MKVVNAVWEKRNLGVDAVEVEFEEQDVLADAEQSLAEIKAQYTVVKVPTTRGDITKMVQQLGYTYIEDLMEMQHDLHEIVRSPLYQRMYDASGYRPMDDDDIRQLFDEVKAGMFSADRISNDEKFDKSVSAKRYTYWMEDLLKNGALPYAILYKEDAVGFVMLQTKDGKIYESVLGGGYMKYRSSGTGIIQKEQEIVKKLGGKKVITHVSTNNASQVKALCMNGYLPGKIRHVFVKHE